MRNIHCLLRHSIILVLGFVALFMLPGSWNPLAAATSPEVAATAPVMTEPTPASLQLRHDPTHADQVAANPVAAQADPDELKYRVATALARLQARKAARAQRIAIAQVEPQPQTALETPVADLQPTVTEPAPVITQEPSAAEPVAVAQEIPVADQTTIAAATQIEPQAIAQGDAEPLFGKALAKMEKNRARRLEHAQKAGLTLPSQGGDLEKTSPTLSRLNQNLKAIINRLP